MDADRVEGWAGKPFRNIHTGEVATVHWISAGWIGFSCNGQGSCIIWQLKTFRKHWVPTAQDLKICVP